jgi:methionine-rich copper-binding protein CopC
MRVWSTLFWVGLALLPLSAEAHAHLVQATPADGSILSVAPDHFLLTFSESAHLTALSIQKAGNSDPQKIQPLPKGASAHFMIPAPKLTPGVYTLKYRVVAVDDGHLSSGAIRFTLTLDAKSIVLPRN